MSLWISKRICSGVAGSMTMSSCAGLERAPEEAVGRPVAEHHHVQRPGFWRATAVQEQQGAIRVAGAGDEEQVRDAAREPRTSPPRSR
jgi:hypothetical protein